MRTRALLLLFVLANLSGCGGGGSNNSPSNITVQIAPTSASLLKQGTATFLGAAQHTTNTAVTWSVQEGAAGGTITTAGVYTAPNTAGTFHVVATSQADTSKTAVAPVTVANVLLQSLTLNATNVTGGASVAGTVTISPAAPAGGTVITLTTSDATATTIPATVTIPAGTTSAAYTITTSPLASRATITLSAALEGVTRTATLSIGPPNLISMSITPTTLTGGANANGTVTFDNPAPVGGSIVTFASSNSSAASVPTSITVPAGAMSAPFTVTTTPLQVNSSVTIGASFGNVTKTSVLTIKAPTVVSVTLNPTSVRGGTPSTGTVTLDGAAPVGGVALTLASSNTAAATVPATVTVPGGATTANFTVTTLTVTANKTAAISATSGTTTKSSNLTVTP